MGRGQEEEEGTSSLGRRRNRILGDRVAGLFVEETERRFDSNITQDSPSTGHRQTDHTLTHTHHISLLSAQKCDINLSSIRCLIGFSFFLMCV